MRRAAWVVLALAFAASSGCRAGDVSSGCAAESPGALEVFVESGASDVTTRFSGEVLAVELRPDGRMRIAVRDEEGVERRVVLLLPGQSAPVAAGRSYGFRVDHVGGFPSASGLVIQDPAGALVFAGASDQGPGELVLRDGVPGLTISLMPSTCPGRSHDDCLESLRNAKIEVRNGQGSVTLMNGQTGVVGSLVATCLVAEEIAYSSRCLDAGRIPFSWTVRAR